MNSSRSARALGSAEVAGDSFVQSHAFEWLSRPGFVARGLIYGIIGILAFKLAIGNVGIAGAVMIGVALYQGYRGITKKFFDDSKVEQMSPRMKEWVGRLGRIGHLARMVVFGLVGIFLIKAAVDYNARAAVGLDGALAKIVHRSYRPLALGVVAVGLIAFALYSLSDARYRRI